MKTNQVNFLFFRGVDSNEYEKHLALRSQVFGNELGMSFMFEEDGTTPKRDRKDHRALLLNVYLNNELIACARSFTLSQIFPYRDRFGHHFCEKTDIKKLNLNKWLQLGALCIKEKYRNKKFPIKKSWGKYIYSNWIKILEKKGYVGHMLSAEIQGAASFYATEKHLIIDAPFLSPLFESEIINFSYPYKNISLHEYTYLKEKHSSITQGISNKDYIKGLKNNSNSLKILNFEKTY